VIVDYHMHLRDEQGGIDHRAEAVEPFVHRARERGIEEIGFTEHVYYFRETRGLWQTDYQRERCVLELEPYVDAVLEAKRRGLPVKLGLEVDWARDRAGELDEILAPYPWDYLLGSVHWLGGVHSVDGARDSGAWAEWSGEEVWRRYADEWCEAARSGSFDALSHPDLPKIFGVRGSDERYDALAAAADAGGAAVEISTAGLRKPVGELYPDERLLRACDAPITLGSDAHEPTLVGEGFERAIAHARACGRDTVTVFDSRVPRQEPLG